jgi:hypothetical protein
MPITIPQGLEVAGTLINNLRDKFPDPVYTGSTPQPDSDGTSLRVQTLYRWMTTGIRDIARRIGWQVEDWYALPLTQYVNTYALDARWRNVTWCFVNQYFCAFCDEPRTIYPAASAAAGSQSYTFSPHKLAGQLDIYLYPGPGASDPVTTLSGTITATQDLISVASSANFLSYGYLRIQDELIQYQRLGTNQVSACRRGVAGTGAVTHGNGTTVTHCGLWVKGIRTPNPVSVSTDPVEIPYDALAALETFVLAQYREFEQSRQEAQSLMEQYREQCASIKGDPTSQQIPGHAAVKAYGSDYSGGVYFDDGFGGLIVR